LLLYCIGALEFGHVTVNSAVRAAVLVAVTVNSCVFLHTWL